MLGLIAAAAITLGAFVFTERRAADPITPLGLFRESVFSISSALFFLSTLVLFAGLLYVPELMQDVGTTARSRPGCSSSRCSPGSSALPGSPAR